MKRFVRKMRKSWGRRRRRSHGQAPKSTEPTNPTNPATPAMPATPAIPAMPATPEMLATPEMPATPPTSPMPPMPPTPPTPATPSTPPASATPPAPATHQLEAYNNSQHDESSSGFTSDDQLVTPSAAELNQYRITGARLQAWIEDPNAPNCNIAQTNLTMQDLVMDAPSEHRFRCEDWHEEIGDLMVGGEPETMGLPAGAMYRVTRLRNRIVNNENHVVNRHFHMVGPGLLVAQSIWRYGNRTPHWNEVARAVYTRDYSMDTLRHLMFENVVNDRTAGYIWRVLYPRRGLSVKYSNGEPPETIQRGTVEYHEFLGTTLGRSAAILLISAFPRGTRSISRIVIWIKDNKVHVRVEIEPFNANR